jgi:hypothetical protein
VRAACWDPHHLTTVVVADYNTVRITYVALENNICSIDNNKNTHTRTYTTVVVADYNTVRD